MVTLATKISDITVEEILQYGFSVLFGLMIIAIILYVIATRKRTAENDAQPLLEENARVIDKQQVAPNTIAFEVWVMFETESGRRVRLNCKPNEMFIIGDEGCLRWQGTRLESFERGKRAAAVKSTGGISTSSAGAPQGYIPAWKRIQMEEEAKNKAE